MVIVESFLYLGLSDTKVVLNAMTDGKRFGNIAVVFALQIFVHMLNNLFTYQEFRFVYSRDSSYQK